MVEEHIVGDSMSIAETLAMGFRIQGHPVCYVLPSELHEATPRYHRMHREARRLHQS